MRVTRGSQPVEHPHVILETHILCVVDMHVLAVSLLLYIARPVSDVATISASMVLCLLAWLGADSPFAGTDDYCRPRGGSHSNSHHGSLGAVDCRSHRCNGVWRVAHLSSRHRHRAHPFSRPTDSIGQKLSPAHYHSYHQCHRQKDLALEIVGMNPSLTSPAIRSKCRNSGGVGWRS